MAAIFSETFGKVAHPLLMLKMDASIKNNKNGVMIFMAGPGRRSCGSYSTNEIDQNCRDGDHQ